MIVVVDYRKGNLKSVERGIVAAGGDARITDAPALIARASGIVLPGVGAFADAAATMHELGQMEVIRERIDAGVPFLGICLGMHLMFEEGVEGAPEEDDEASSHNARGLAVLPGVVGKMPSRDAAGAPYKVPHVGWNSVVPPALAERSELAGRVQSLRQSGSHGTSTGRSGSCGTRFVGAPDELRLGDKRVEQSDLGGDGDSCGNRLAGFASPLFEGIPVGEYFYFTHSYIAPDSPATVALTEHSVAFPSAVQFRDVAFGVQFHPEKSSDAGARVLRNFVNIVKGA